MLCIDTMRSPIYNTIGPTLVSITWCMLVNLIIFWCMVPPLQVPVWEVPSTCNIMREAFGEPFTHVMASSSLKLATYAFHACFYKLEIWALTSFKCASPSFHLLGSHPLPPVIEFFYFFDLHFEKFHVGNLLVTFVEETPPPPPQHKMNSLNFT